MNERKCAHKCDYRDGVENIKKYTSNIPVPYKESILKYMKSFECVAAAAGMVYDEILGVNTKTPLLAYEKDGFCWDSRDIYYFEKYNIQLNEDFVAYVLDKINLK